MPLWFFFLLLEFVILKLIPISSFQWVSRWFCRIFCIFLDIRLFKFAWPYNRLFFSLSVPWHHFSTLFLLLWGWAGLYIVGHLFRLVSFYSKIVLLPLHPVDGLSLCIFHLLVDNIFWFIIIIILLIESFYHQCWQMVFHLSLSNSRSP